MAAGEADEGRRGISRLGSDRRRAAKLILFGLTYTYTYTYFIRYTASTVLNLPILAAGAK